MRIDLGPLKPKRPPRSSRKQLAVDSPHSPGLPVVAEILGFNVASSGFGFLRASGGILWARLGGHNYLGLCRRREARNNGNGPSSLKLLVVAVGTAITSTNQSVFVGV